MAKSNIEKRKPKNEPRLNLSLNEEQKEVKRLFYEFDVNFVLGDAGSGKTLASTAIALTSFRKREYDKIVVTRPIVRNSLGFLPGEMGAKMKPWIVPIIHNFNMCQASSTTEKMMEDNQIEILPIDFAKGITYVNSVVIIDEFQDMDYDDFRIMLTRLGKDSKIIFCGSKEQVHPSMKSTTCLEKAMRLDGSGLVGFSELTSNHRNPALVDIINYLEKS